MTNFYHLSILFLQRIFYGELSAKYYFSLQRFRKLHPNTTITFKTCFKTEVILHLDKLCIRQPALNVYRTLDTIQFDNMDYGVGYKKICRYKGKPESAKYEWIGDKLVRVICYKDKMLERSVKINYFLIDDRYFLGEFHFQQYNQTVIESVRSILLAKYHCQINTGETRFYITDQSNSLILYDDSGLNLCVKYYFPQIVEIDQYLKKIISKTPFKKERIAGKGKSLADIL